MQQSFRSTTFQLRKAKDRRAFNGETQVNPPCSRRRFVHTSLIAGAALALPTHLRASTSVAKPDFLVEHYHVHLSPQLSIEQAVKFGKQVGIGIVEHLGLRVQNPERGGPHSAPLSGVGGARSK